MLNKLLAFQKQYRMLQPGDRVFCAVSGGADSVALLFAMYLLREKLQITVEAAHFNHHLRDEESDRDEAFVQALCARYEIPLHLGSGQITAGKKGLEAAARVARYDFFSGLPGKIATAHTADDNAETVLMHLVRGTGLKGLGGIAPVRGQLIRPMLSVTRQEVLAFLAEYNLSWVQDSSNDSDVFLRNRLRHHVMPLLIRENPNLAENLSATALRLREDEEVLSAMVQTHIPGVEELRSMPTALRSRWISGFLQQNGVPEPDSKHIGMVQNLIFSNKPSAAVKFPGGVTVRRSYNRLEVSQAPQPLETRQLQVPCRVELPALGLIVSVDHANSCSRNTDCFTVHAGSGLCLRSRLPGDTIRLTGGTKELRKIYIDRKIPAHQRLQLPVLADDRGVLGAWSVGANLDRLATQLPALEIRFERKIIHGGQNRDDTD